MMAIFCPITWFINVDFPTFGRPKIATNPDLNLLFVIALLYHSQWDETRFRITGPIINYAIEKRRIAVATLVAYRYAGCPSQKR